jgi:outer membrane protein insertion porin family
VQPPEGHSQHRALDEHQKSTYDCMANRHMDLRSNAGRLSLAQLEYADIRLAALIVFFWLTIHSWAQTGNQAAAPVFDGQKVTAVDLIGNPHRDLEPFRAYIVQKVGEPYSQDRVEASRQTLQKAGVFAKVDVNIVPEFDGVRVSFLLEPAYYLGIVEFPGATRIFSYTRLQQVADLPDEDPYDAARIPIAQKALENFFRHSGYFQATAQNSIQIDDAHRIVNVNFTVNLGKQAKIAAVQIAGVDSSETARLLHSTRSLRARLIGGLLKPGKRYSSERVKQATTLIKRSLSQQHRLASSVQENPPQYHAENNTVDISFKVKVGPIVSVSATGAKLTVIPFLSGRELKKLVPIYSERSIDNELVQEGQQNLVDYFQKKGYYDVAIKINFTQQPDKIAIVYEINRGKKHKVDHILFHGNNQIATRDLLQQVTISKSHIWTHGNISRGLLRQSVSNIEALYRDKGYEDVKVVSRVVDHEPKLDVDFEITEGPETLVGDVTVTGNDHVPHDQLTAPKGFELRAGAPYSPRELSDDRNRISANYLNRGYPNAEVKVSVQRHDDDPHRLDVTYAITEHQLVRVGEIAYLGQQHTRLSLVKNTTDLPTEAPLKRGQLLAAETRLYDLNIFDWASVGPSKPITDEDDETTLVKVHEAKRNNITYGFGFEVAHRGGNVPSGTVAVPGLPTVSLGQYKIAPSQATYASPLGSIDFHRLNMRGLGETANASLLLSRLDQRILTTYLQPHFFGSKWSSLSSISLERTTENPLFAASLGDASFQVERVLNQKTNTRLQIRYDFNKTDLSHLLVPALVLPQDLKVHLSTFSGTLIRDTRDKPLDAHHGVFETVNVGITPVALGSSANFARLFGQFATYKPFHGVVLANSIRLGMAKEFSNSFVPTSQLYFSGGGTTLRSFPIDEAGPQRLVPFCTGLQNQSGCVSITVPVGGDMLFIVNSEVRFPLKIMKNLGAVVFYDGGNVYSAISLPNFASNYTNTIGIGLRYETPVGPIRIDLGHNLNPVPGIDATQYYITLGQAF